MRVRQTGTSVHVTPATLLSVAGARTDQALWDPVSTLPAGGRALGKLPAFVPSLGVLCQGIGGRPQGMHSKAPVVWTDLLPALVQSEWVPETGRVGRAAGPHSASRLLGLPGRSREPSVLPWD